MLYNRGGVAGFKSFTTTLAGLPIATEYGGMSVTTTLFTPMIAPSPIVTPFKMKEFWPIQAFLQT
jgi:hypothetical protein